MSYDPDARRDTPLALKLKKRIRREGPIPVAQFMQACLQDPEHGYYVKQQAIGRAGDFITAPEISQIFGELIGMWCAVAWQQMGSPAHVNLVELGPGRGTLMGDLLRVVRKVPQFQAAIEAHLVELSPALEQVQRNALADAGIKIKWHASLASVPKQPTIVIANEYLDTAPVHQTCGSTERLVGLDDGGHLAFEACDEVIQESQDFAALSSALAARAYDMLAALFIDYGHVRSAPGDTLQAVRGHAAEHPLCSPGEADLTVQVDFEAFAEAIPRDVFAVDGPITQAEFLGRLGVVERASRLMHANPTKAAEIELAVARLIAPQGMGSRFKAIAIRSLSLPPLPAFE